MIDADEVTLRKKLDELSDRLRAREDDFRQKGRFSDVQKAFLKRIRQRSDGLKKKVAEAGEKGTTRELMQTELLRDCNSIFDDLLQLEERLDAEFMQQSSSQ
jgi:hypothetical protein